MMSMIKLRRGETAISMASRRRRCRQQRLSRNRISALGLLIWIAILVLNFCQFQLQFQLSILPGLISSSMEHPSLEGRRSTRVSARSSHHPHNKDASERSLLRAKHSSPRFKGSPVVLSETTTASGPSGQSREQTALPRKETVEYASTSPSRHTGSSVVNVSETVVDSQPTEKYPKSEESVVPKKTHHPRVRIPTAPPPLILGEMDAPPSEFSATSRPTPELSSPSFPETKFTPHVRSLLHIMETVTLALPPNTTTKRHEPAPFDPHRHCFHSYHLIVDQPYSPPSSIECHPPNEWCDMLQRLFDDPKQKRILPYNVSLGISSNDAVWKRSRHWGQCIASSAEQGEFSMNNFLDNRARVEAFQGQKYATHNNVQTGYLHSHTRVWDDRHTVPVFRGHPRMPTCANITACCDQNDTVANGAFGHRAQVVWVSYDRPDLINARVSPMPHSRKNACMMFNRTNGMDQLFGVGDYSSSQQQVSAMIPPSEYYTDYQVAVVLGGVGAAFRTPIHLSAGQAVVLQRFKYEEWYIPYLTPWVDYVPLQEDLSDLQTVLEWVRDHPEEVKTIAGNGQAFYHKWLSFVETDQHWYELLWRLSELLHEKGPDHLKEGNGRTIWPDDSDSSVPYRFVRNSSRSDGVVDSPM